MHFTLQTSWKALKRIVRDLTQHIGIKPKDIDMITNTNTRTPSPPKKLDYGAIYVFQKGQIQVFSKNMSFISVVFYKRRNSKKLSTLSPQKKKKKRN